MSLILNSLAEIFFNMSIFFVSSPVIIIWSTYIMKIALFPKGSCLTHTLLFVRDKSSVVCISKWALVNVWNILNLFGLDNYPCVNNSCPILMLQTTKWWKWTSVSWRVTIRLCEIFLVEWHIHSSDEDPEDIMISLIFWLMCEFPSCIWATLSYSHANWIIFFSL